MRNPSRLSVTALGIAGVTLLAACSSGSSGGKSSAQSTPSTGGSAGSAAQVTATSFSSSDFNTMKQLTGVAAAGKGKVAVLLPDTTTSARYTEFDAPYLKSALEAAGLSSSNIIINNAQGSDSTQQTQAESAITSGATVLLVDPLDSGVGKTIESNAKSKGVKTIDYDRLTLGGSRDYYVSFNNVKVGQLIGQGFVDCVTAWKVSKPNVLVMRGDPTDNNATLFAQGYNGVLAPYFSSGKYVKVGEPAGTWDPPTAATTFQQQYTAHKNINGVVMPNDATAAAVISILKTNKIKPNTFPTTGQDAQVSGDQNVLTGYQCGTVYKPIRIEAQAAAALALYTRAGQTPPSGLVNGQTTDTKANTQVPSSLLTPVWVTPTNMKDTVVKDGTVSASQLCAGSVQTYCTKYGIS